MRIANWTGNHIPVFDNLGLTRSIYGMRRINVDTASGLQQVPLKREPPGGFAPGGSSSR